MKKLFFLFFIFIVNAFNSHGDIAKNGLKINDFTIKADLFEGFKEDKKNDIFNPYELFNGNVKITNDKFYIKSNFAKRITNNNEENFEIYDKVKIVKQDEDLEITAEKVKTVLGKDIIDISDNIKCVKNDITFTSKACSYNTSTNIIEYKNGGNFIKRNLENDIEENNIYIKSDRGEGNIVNNEFTLTNNVEIKNQNFTITCRKTNYSQESNKIQCSGDIRIGINDRQGEYITTPDDGYFDIGKKIITITNGLYISANQLICGGKLTYDQTQNKVIVIDGVELIMKNKLRFTCDNCVYDIKTKHGELKGNTIVYNSEATEKNYLYVDGNEFCFDVVEKKNIDSEEDDDYEDEFDELDKKTFEHEEVVNADSQEELKLEQQQDKKQKEVNKSKKRKDEKNKNEVDIVIYGKGNVSVCTNKFKCRSSEIKFKGNKIFFEKDTIIWNENNLLTGKDIEIKLANDGNVDTVKVKKEPFILSVDDLGFYNQISGNRLKAYLKDNIFDRALVIDDINTIYFYVADKKLTGVNRLTCSEFKTVFDDKNKIKKIYFNNKISGSFAFPDAIVDSDNPEKTEKNKLNFLLNRFVEKSEFIRETKQPSLEDIKLKIKDKSLISDEDIQNFYKGTKLDVDEDLDN